MSKYLLLEPKVKAIAPNLALMKWARWCENNNHEYKYVRGIVDLKDFVPDKILMSCIFSYFSKIYEIEIDHYLRQYPKSEFTIGGVFPTINPDWFSKEKWMDCRKAQALLVALGLKFIGGRIQLHKGLHSAVDTLAPKYTVNIEYEDDQEPYPNDKIILYTSRGCVNKCAYCAVPKVEPEHISFKSIQYMLDASKTCNNTKECVSCDEKEDCFYHKSTGVFIYDNNFTEHKHDEQIIKELKEFKKPVDFRQGLHVDAFTKRHATLFKELQWLGQGESGTSYIRFSFDKMKYANNIERALRYISEADAEQPKLPKLPEVFCYMLFNFHDSPADFWKRIVLAQGMVDRQRRSLFLFPMKYEPYDSEKRNSYIGSKWKAYNKDGQLQKWTDYLTPDQKELLITADDPDSILVRGLVKLITYAGHGFIPVTKSSNLYAWIGDTEEKFIRRCFRMPTDKAFNSNLKSYKLKNPQKPLDI